MTAANFQLFCESVPGVAFDRFEELCAGAWKEDSKLALSLFAWLGTLGGDADVVQNSNRENKKVFYMAMMWLQTNYPSTLANNLERIAAHASLHSILDVLMFAKNQTGPNSLGVQLQSACSGEDWRSTATSEKLREEFDSFVRLDTFAQLQVVAEESEAKGDSADKLFDSVADLFATGLQQELNRAQTKGVTWDWYKQPFVFAMGSPMPGGLHDTATDIVNGIITRLFGASSGDALSRYQVEVVAELQATEAQRQGLHKVIENRERMFKRQLLRVMGAPVKEQRAALTRLLIMKRAIDEANRRAQLPETIRCAFTPGNGGSHASSGGGVTIGERKVFSFLQAGGDSDMEDDQWAEWEDKIGAGRKGGKKKQQSGGNGGGARQSSAKAAALRSMLLAKAKKKGAASEKKAAKTGAAVRVQPASVAGAKAGAAAGEPGGGAEQAEQAHVQTAQTEQTDQSQGQSQSQTEARVAAAAGEEQQEVPAQDEEGMAELEERMKAWMKAVEEECTRIEEDEVALREIAEERMKVWVRETEKEMERAWERATERADGARDVEDAVMEIERDVEDAMRDAWVRELEAQYNEIEADAEAFLAMAEQKPEGKAAPGKTATFGIQDADDELRGEWVTQVKRQWSELQLVEIEDEPADGYARMAKNLVREASSYLADDEEGDAGDDGGDGENASIAPDESVAPEGWEEEMDGRGTVWLDLPLDVVLGKCKGWASVSAEAVEARLADMLAVQELGDGDEEAMREVEEEMKKEWVEEMARQAEEVQEDGDCFVRGPRIVPTPSVESPSVVSPSAASSDSADTVGVECGQATHSTIDAGVDKITGETTLLVPV